MNYKELFENKEYEKIIELTKDSKDPNELFIRLSTFIQINKYDDALFVIENNREILEKKIPFQTMQIHMELLLMKKDFSKAKEEAEHYQTLPYINQEVEEYLADLPNLINDAMNHKDNMPRLSYEEIDEIISSSTDQNELASVLFSLDDYNINKLIPCLDILLIRSDVHPNLRTFGLILLVQNKIDDMFHFLKDGKRIIVNPSKLTPPYHDVNFKQCFSLIKAINHKNPSLNDVSIQLFNNYILDTYPENILENEDLNVVANAVVELAKEYMSIPSDNFDEKIVSKKREIKETIEKTPALTF